jgi:hypothetical protein
MLSAVVTAQTTPSNISEYIVGICVNITFGNCQDLTDAVIRLYTKDLVVKLILNWVSFLLHHLLADENQERNNAIIAFCELINEFAYY